MLNGLSSRRNQYRVTACCAFWSTYSVPLIGRCQLGPVRASQFRASARAVENQSHRRCGRREVKAGEGR